MDDRKSILPEVISLLGRSLLRVGQIDKATEQYNTIKGTDRLIGDFIALSHELDNLPTVEKDFKSDAEKNFHKLCRLQSKTSGSADHRLQCRHTYILIPYFRFGEEIISNSPYVSIFYDVITDEHLETVKKETKSKLARSTVGANDPQASPIRISHTAFLKDYESEIATFISKRISYLTKLEAGPYAAEDHQIVNYGLGGYYNLHRDTFDHVDKGSHTQYVLDNFGNRLATFLIYLTDVERGGSTAFPNADLAVSSVKGQALFWYNLSPALSVEFLTRHAACPVVIGEKWIINKWILSYPNMFTRR
ncbi:Prolyl 4-hydroxylase subunit alpha-1 [Bulinus truncatus]|nr:Prolyl 4-hydroxylase subunit alpha-1 [Bulinus truncatus]